jgi:hypothetical protein
MVIPDENVGSSMTKSIGHYNAQTPLDRRQDG